MSSLVVIGIQARTGSTRFPNKVLELIDGKTVLQHVIDACKASAQNLNKFSRSNNCTISTALLIPSGDKLLDMFQSMSIQVGPEDDVLKRYVLACETFGADYMVRITSDCPLIPSPIITKLIKTGIMNNYDYASNVAEETRTAFDGKDCEFISKKALLWLDQNAVHADDRQHVTTLLRREPPRWVKQGFITDYLDLSDLKLSVDTQEDLERVRQAYNRLKSKMDYAYMKYGKSNVHKF